MNTPDIIGTIYKPTGKLITEDGFEYEEQAPISGYHVNFISEVPELAEFKLDPQPATPSRVYAGGIMPVCYSFASRTEWEAEWQKVSEVGE